MSVRPQLHGLLEWPFAVVLDIAPGWIWRPANLRFVGSHAVHFCFDGNGHRTVEFDGREVLAGRREHTHGDAL